MGIMNQYSWYEHNNTVDLAKRYRIRTPLLKCEYRRVLNCMSRETGAHDIVCGFREVRMESSVGEGGNISKAARGLCMFKRSPEWLF